METGPSARNGSTRRGRTPTCPGGPAGPVRRRRTSRRPHPGRRPRCWRHNSTTRTHCGRSPNGSATGPCGPQHGPPCGVDTTCSPTWPQPSTEPHTVYSPRRNPDGGTDSPRCFGPWWTHRLIELLGGPATAPVPARCSTSGCGVRAAHRARQTRRCGSDTAPTASGPRMRLRTGHGGRLRRGRVHRFLVDGPSLRGDTAAARTVGSTDVVRFGRDLEVTYRVWSPRPATRPQCLSRLPHLGPRSRASSPARHR